MVINASNLRSELVSLADYLGTNEELAEKYLLLLQNILTNSGSELVETLKLFVEAIVDEHVSLVISRQILTVVVVELTKLNDQVSKIVSHYTLDKIETRLISFEEQVVGIREHLAKIYEKNQNWREATNVLVGISLGPTQYSADYKRKTFLKIARLHLEDEERSEAEAFINRALFTS